MREPLPTLDGFRIGDLLEELTLYGAASLKTLPEDLRQASGAAPMEPNAGEISNRVGLPGGCLSGYHSELLPDEVWISG